MWPDRHKSFGMCQPRRLSGHTEDVLSLAFCPPNLLCTGSYDGTVLVHNCESGVVQWRIQVQTPTSSKEESAPDDAREDARCEARLPAAVLAESPARTAVGIPAAASASTTAHSSVSPLLRSVAVESLTILDPERRVLPDSVLVGGAADGYVRLWSVRTMSLLVEARVCPTESDGIHNVCVEESATLLATGDSAGRISIFDVSSLADVWYAPHVPAHALHRQHLDLYVRHGMCLRSLQHPVGFLHTITMELPLTLITQGEFEGTKLTVSRQALSIGPFGSPALVLLACAHARCCTDCLLDRHRGDNLCIHGLHSADVDAFRGASGHLWPRWAVGAREEDELV